jgi:O-antigen/teichoic acid export membrane protein
MSPVTGASPAEEIELRRLLPYVAPLVLARTGNVSLAYLDRVVIAVILGGGVAGAFAAAHDLAEQTIGALAAVLSAAWTPGIFAAFDDGNVAEASRKIEGLISVFGIVVVPVVVIFVFAGDVAASLLLGPAFRGDAAVVLGGVAAASAVMYYKGVVVDIAFHLKMRTGWIAAISFMALALNLAGIALLVKGFGVPGAVAAKLGAYSAACICAAIVGVGILRLRLWSGGLLIALASGAVMALVLTGFSPGAAAGRQLAAVVCGLLAYGACVTAGLVAQRLRSSRASAA